jgi:hypothetical protein
MFVFVENYLTIDYNSGAVLAVRRYKINYLQNIKCANNISILLYLKKIFGGIMAHQTYLVTEAKAWLKRKQGPDEVIKIVPDLVNSNTVLTYLLYSAYDERPTYFGRILFDAKGYWIYDGDDLTVPEQEQVARIIINYIETL